MHKSYQSSRPCSNKLLQRRWDAQYYDAHRAKLRDVKPMVDTRPPKTYMHLHLKLKKLQLEEERLATIEKDNRILLEKMSHIMRTRGRIDNRNDYEYRSLNREKRQRELLRVTRENQEILKRIMAREPEYDHKKWEQEWEENQAYMDSIAQYPKDWWKEDRENPASDRRRGKKQGKKKTKEEESRRSSEDSYSHNSNTEDERQKDDKEDNGEEQGEEHKKEEEDRKEDAEDSRSSSAQSGKMNC